MRLELLKELMLFLLPGRNYLDLLGGFMGCVSRNPCTGTHIATSIWGSASWSHSGPDLKWAFREPFVSDRTSWQTSILQGRE